MKKLVLGIHLNQGVSQGIHLIQRVDTGDPPKSWSFFPCGSTQIEELGPGIHPNQGVGPGHLLIVPLPFDGVIGAIHSTNSGTNMQYLTCKVTAIGRLVSSFGK